MSEIAIPTNVETLVDLRVASGNVPQGQFKIVKGNIEGKPDYAIFANDTYIGSFTEQTEEDARFEGLKKIGEILKYGSAEDFLEYIRSANDNARDGYLGMLRLTECDAVPWHLVKEEETNE